MKLYYIYNFIIYSVFGYVLEMVFQLIIGVNPNSGLTFGPYAVMYGIIVPLIYSIYKKIDTKYPYMKKAKKYFIFFTVSFLLCTIFEYTAGNLIELLFDMVFWNYNKLPLHFGKYISLLTSIAWGIFPIILYYFIKPITDKIFVYTKQWMITSLSSIIIADMLISIIFLL